MTWRASVQLAGGGALRATCHQASNHGLIFSCEQEFKAGSLVALNLDWPQHDRASLAWVALPLRVMFSRSSGNVYRMACDFQPMSGDTQRRLAQALQRHARAGLRAELQPSVARVAAGGVAAGGVAAGNSQSELLMRPEGFARYLAAAPGERTLFTLCGQFDEAGLKNLPERLHERLEPAGLPTPLRRKLYATAIELGRNIGRHGLSPNSAAGPAGDAPGGLSLGRTSADGAPGGACFVRSASLVRAGQIEPLAGLMRDLRALDADGLQRALRHCLFGTTDPISDDAATEAAAPGRLLPGFGLLTAVRESAAPIDHVLVQDDSTGPEHACFVVRLWL